MAGSFDLDEDDDVDTMFAKRLIRQGSRTRAELPVLWVDPDKTDAEIQQASELLGQPIQRRRR